MKLDEKTIALSGLGASGIGWLAKQFCNSEIGYNTLSNMGFERGDIVYGLGVSELVAFGGIMATLYGGTKLLTKKLYNKSNKETISNLTGAWTGAYTLDKITHDPDWINKFRETLYSIDSYSPALEDLARDVSHAAVYILPIFIALGVVSGLFNNEKK